MIPRKTNLQEDERMNRETVRNATNTNKLPANASRLERYQYRVRSPVSPGKLTFRFSRFLFLIFAHCSFGVSQCLRLSIPSRRATRCSGSPPIRSFYSSLYPATPMKGSCPRKQSMTPSESFAFVLLGRHFYGPAYLVVWYSLEFHAWQRCNASIFIAGVSA